MTNEIALRRPGRSWQFSLKSLMFLMFIVAVCAGTISISPPLAVLVVPFVAVAAVRTALCHSRVAPEEPMPSRTSGLLATFVQSLLLLMALSIMSFATLAAVGLATALIAATLAVRVVTAVGIKLRALAPQARRCAWALWRGLRSVVRQIRPYQILSWFRARAVIVTAELYVASRRLLRQCWCAEGECHTTRTEPL
jgi:hypothetical protein